MTHIIRDKSGTFRVRWRDGGKYHSSQRFDRKGEAMAFQRSLDAKIVSESIHDGITPIGWDELVARYIKSRPESTTLHRSLAKAAMMLVAQRHGLTNAADVCPELAPKLKIHEKRLVRALLRFAADIGQRVNPRAIPALRPKPKRLQPQCLLTDEEVEVLIAKAATWHPADAAIARLVATYGHRVESLLGLTPESLSARPGWIRMRVKSGDIHEHPIKPDTSAMLEPLAKLAAPGQPFLIGHLGKPWPNGGAYSAWWIHNIASDSKAKQRKGAGILDLRRYAISRMMTHTGDPKTVASITGHRTPSLLLNVYARTSEDRQRAALASIPDAPGLHPAKVITP